MTVVLTRDRRGRFETQRPREEGQVEVEADIEVALAQAKEHQEPTETRKGKEGAWPAGTLIWDF